ncbi:DUF1206 domain-containing protein [uncultured Hymenobacter sp.]|uniref:DUF1206 domain-containing protein n=1 Tax=uncultured Hymenobacter sp. TaxID=170016 RepID=UPI0035C9C2FD
MTTKVKLSPPVKKTVQVMARWSYVVKGILFCGVAVFAVRMALGLSRKEPNQRQVLETLFSQPLGQLMLLVVALALSAHTLWRVVETIEDPYQKGTSPGGLLHRFTYLLSGITYGSLAVTTFKLVFGNQAGGENTNQLWVAQLLHREGGEWLVVVAGAVMLTWALVQLKKALTQGLYKSLEIDDLPAFWRGLIHLVGAVGFITQSSMLAGMGYYLLRAAWLKNPRYVKSIDDLLELVGHMPHGTTWLLLLAGGIFLFGLFMFVMARYFPLKLTQHSHTA